MFIMKKVDMYGVLRVQIDDGAQNGPGHLLKIFFCQKGHDHSISYLLSSLQTITSALSYAWCEQKKMFFVEFKNVCKL